MMKIITMASITTRMIIVMMIIKIILVMILMIMTPTTMILVIMAIIIKKYTYTRIYIYSLSLSSWISGTTHINNYNNNGRYDKDFYTYHQFHNAMRTAIIVNQYHSKE